LDFL